MTVSRNTAGAKSAETETPSPTVTEHVELPEQAPVQRTSFEPVPGVAVSTTCCPLFQVVVQLAVHSSPGTSPATDPVPETVRSSGVWASSRTSHAESWVSVHAPEWP